MASTVSRFGAGATAQLRAQFILTEAAGQSATVGTQKYNDEIAKIPAIAQRAGDATQKLAVAKLQADTAFNTSQLGRNTIDASVADQLKGAFGTNADQNSAIANTIRLNETMKDLKGTVTDVANGAFTDFRTALEGGSTAMQALGTVSINVLNKIIDKLANKVLDTGISNLFGAFLGSGSGGGTGFSLTGTGGLYDQGGYTGPGGRLQPAGIVHRGEVVFSQADVAAHGGVSAVEALRTFRGYAGGGPVGGSPWAPSAPSFNPPAAGSQGASPATQGVHVSVGVSVDSKGELQAYVKGVTTTTLVNYVASPAHVDNTAAAWKIAKSHRKV